MAPLCIDCQSFVEHSFCMVVLRWATSPMYSLCKTLLCSILAPWDLRALGLNGVSAPERRGVLSVRNASDDGSHWYDSSTARVHPYKPFQCSAASSTALPPKLLLQENQCPLARMVPRPSPKTSLFTVSNPVHNTRQKYTLVNSSIIFDRHVTTA